MQRDFCNSDLRFGKENQAYWAETGCYSISGGLDSTLALLVTAKAFDLLNIPRKNIWQLPCRALELPM